jgi:lipopolysaccharide export system permease protein
MSLFKLTQVSRYLAQNGLQNREYMFNFWRRVFQPLAALVMVLLAIPFVLGALKHSALGLRMMLGLLIGFIFFIANSILAQLSVLYQIPTFFAALLPILLFAILAFVLINRMLKY